MLLKLHLVYTICIEWICVQIHVSCVIKETSLVNYTMCSFISASFVLNPYLINATAAWSIQTICALLRSLVVY